MIDLIVQKQNEEIIKRLSTLEYIIENMPNVLKMVEQNTSRRVPQSINMHNDLLERFNRLEKKIDEALNSTRALYAITREDLNAWVTNEVSFSNDITLKDRLSVQKLFEINSGAAKPTPKKKGK